MPTVLYPGSFDPVTNGHVRTIVRLKKMFGDVVVLVADSSRKKYLFTSSERVELIRKSLSDKKIKVVADPGLTVDAARRVGAQLIARSVRSVADWEYEYSLADANKQLDGDIETVFITADRESGFISSSLVKEIAQLDGDVSRFVPAPVDEALKKMFKKTKKQMR